MVKHLKGIRQILVIYPYVVAGGFTVAEKSSDGQYDARFGLILTQDSDVCKKGYEGTDRRSAAGHHRPADEHQGRLHRPDARTTAGAEKAPRGRTGTAYRSPVATYDASDRQGRSGPTRTPAPQIAYDGGAAAAVRRGLLEVDAPPAVACPTTRSSNP